MYLGLFPHGKGPCKKGMGIKMYEKAGCCAALFLLGYLSDRDIRTKKLPAASLLASGILAAVYIVLGEEISVSYVTGCMMPGMILLLLAMLTKEKIGYGDGATVLVMGLWTGGFFCAAAALIGIFLSGVYGLCLLITGRGKTIIPFVPFLLAAMEVILLNE